MFTLFCSNLENTLQEKDKNLDMHDTSFHGMAINSTLAKYVDNTRHNE